MSLFDAVALVCGTAVGGGFLAIPEVTAPLGVLPSTVGLTVTWLFLMMAGLAYVEAAGAASGEGRGASILALSRHAFGAKRAAIVSCFFLMQMLAASVANLIMGAQLAGICWAMPWLPAGASVWLIACAFCPTLTLTLALTLTPTLTPTPTPASTLTLTLTLTLAPTLTLLGFGRG